MAPTTFLLLFLSFGFSSSLLIFFLIFSLSLSLLLNWSNISVSRNKFHPVSGTIPKKSLKSPSINQSINLGIPIQIQTNSSSSNRQRLQSLKWLQLIERWPASPKIFDHPQHRCSTVQELVLFNSSSFAYRLNGLWNQRWYRTDEFNEPSYS